MHWIRTNWLVAAGLAAAVVGLVLITIAALAAPTSATFGWFAYAPLANVPPPPGPTAGEIFGWSLAGVGLVLIAGVFGYYRGRSRT